jgi:hypothetical protein
MFFTAAFTLGGRFRPAYQACPDLPIGHSFGPAVAGRISATRIQKLSLTRPDEALSRFGTVSAAVDWQGLDAPIVVELFVRRTFHARARELSLPAGRCCHRQTPDASVR